MFDLPEGGDAIHEVQIRNNEGSLHTAKYKMRARIQGSAIGGRLQPLRIVSRGLLGVFIINLIRQIEKEAKITNQTAQSWQDCSQRTHFTRKASKRDPKPFLSIRSLFYRRPTKRIIMLLLYHCCYVPNVFPKKSRKIGENFSQFHQFGLCQLTKPLSFQFQFVLADIFQAFQCSINVIFQLPTQKDDSDGPENYGHLEIQCGKEGARASGKARERVAPWILIMAVFLILNNINISLDPLSTMSTPISHPSPLLFHKIHFSLNKRVKYGQGIFVCGNTAELGNWQPCRAYRLKWTENDLWSASLLLSPDAPQTLEYKYIIADWHDPARAPVEWELGTHNRRADLAPRTTVVCDDRWNMDRVTLTLAVGRARTPLEEKYYVVGDIAELGSWEEKKLMKRVPRKAGPRREGVSGASAQGQQERYSFSFYTFRAKEQFHYYYIKKSATTQSERRPGRVFSFKNQTAPHPARIRVAHPRGEINLLDESIINQLVFSQVTPQIFVGSYPKSALDIQKLKENKITAVFSIQSERDFKSHGLTPHYLSLLCQEHGLRYKRHSILDMNNEDFVSKAQGGVKMMRELIREGERVYVHCSAGIYRSPQMIALYLTLFERYSLEQAVSTVKAHHPYAKPNPKVVRDAAGLIQLHRAHNRAVPV